MTSIRAILFGCTAIDAPRKCFLSLFWKFPQIAVVLAQLPDDYNFAPTSAL
jgi:hypothetical protein